MMRNCRTEKLIRFRSEFGFVLQYSYVVCFFTDRLALPHVSGHWRIAGFEFLLSMVAGCIETIPLRIWSEHRGEDN
jgi:hypothetical protein